MRCAGRPALLVALTPLLRRSVLFASKPVVQLLVNPAASHATVSAGAQPVLVTGARRRRSAQATRLIGM